MEIDSIHFYVLDADRMRDLAIGKMGLKSIEKPLPIALRSLVGNNTRIDLVGTDRLLFSISSPSNSASPVADYLKSHPSGVKDISFRVADLDEIRCRIDRLGINILAAADRDELPWLKIQGWGAIEHTIIQAESESSDVVRRTEDLITGIDRIVLNVATDVVSKTEDLITGIDHIVLNVATGELEPATNWYRDLFGFQVQQTFDVRTARSGLASHALVSPCGKIRFNINEPSSHNSQIQEFIDFNRGAGIQHIALETRDIFTTVDRLQRQNLPFLNIPDSYYANLLDRAASLTPIEWERLERLQILVDRSAAIPDAVLLQIFTQPIFEVPTFFFELIERRNRAQGFGRGNFQALFEAVENYSQLASNPSC